MNIQSLQYFVSAAKHLSFTQAADEFMIAQSAMSKQIAGIEDELGVKLFYRFTRRVELTPAGSVFYTEALEVLQRYGNAVFLARDAHFESKEKLSVGFGMFETQIVSAHIKKFASLYPDVSVTLTQHFYDILIQNLNKGVCDIAFCPQYRVEHLKNIYTIPVKSEKSIIAVSKMNPLAEKASVTPEDLEQQVFIVLSKDGMVQSEIFRTFCLRSGFTPKRILYTNTFDSVMAMVNAGYGLAAVPRFLKGIAKYDIEFLPLKTKKDRKRIHVVVALISNDSKEVKSFLKMSEEHYRISY